MRRFLLWLFAFMVTMCAAVVNALAVTAKDSVLEVVDAGPLLKGDVRDIDQRRRIWDQQQVLAALQGIANRESPRIYVLAVGKDGRIDKYWMEKLRRPGQWLAEWQVRQQGNFDALIAEYRPLIRGIVVWDERVPATALAASTAAGADDLLPVRYDARPDSLYTFLTTAANGPHFPVQLRLLNADGSQMFTGSRTGSAKCDATLWAVDHYLRTGKCDPHHLAYYPDAFWIKEPAKVTADRTLVLNHDYFISKRAFFFDLDPWDDETPIDDRNQKMGTDPATLMAVLRAAHDRAGGKPINVGGFVPWQLKYTQVTGGRHLGVPTEWRYADIISCFDGYMDADAPGFNAMANASVFCHFPTAERYPQKNFPTIADLRENGFVDGNGNVKPLNYAAIYAGDYDSAAWLYQRMQDSWDDPNRGRVAAGWAFDPSLEQRFPVGLAYARETATENDAFIAGDSGYGYLNPGDLTPPRKWSGLPSGLAGWQELSQEGYRRWDLRITGFVIDGSAPGMNAQVRNAYAEFSPMGVIGQGISRLSLVNGTPFMPMGTDLPNAAKGAEVVSQFFGPTKMLKARFGEFRTVLWSPTQMLQLSDLLAKSRSDVRIVSPYVLMQLAAISLRRG